MASPAVAAVVEGGLTSAGTSLAVTLPAGGSAADEYIVVIAKGSVSCTINALAGWTELLDEAVAAGLAIIRYTGSGVPSNPTFVQSVSSRSVWCAYRISSADKSIAPEVGTTATGTSTTPDPPARAVTGGPKDILAIACFAAGASEAADTDVLVTTFPTNYTDGQVEKTGGTTGTNLAGLLGAAARQVAATSSENPGTFLQNASRAWRANTIVVHPAPPPKSTAVARISLAPGNTPDTRTLHTIKVLARATGGVGTLRAALYEGATNRSGDLESSELTGTLAEYSIPISDANAANITSYSDLEIRFWGYSASGDAVTVEIDKIWLEIPESSGTTYYGSSAMTVTFGSTISGIRKTFAQLQSTFTFTKNVLGQKKTFGQILMPLVFGKNVLSQKKTFSQIAMPLTFSKDVRGQRTTFGQITFPFVFGKNVLGQRKTFGQISFPINAFIATAGNRLAKTLYGIMSLPIAFGAAIDGKRKTLGQIALPVSFSKDVRGQRKTFGQLLSPFIFGKSVVGQRKTFNQVSLPLSIAIATSGLRLGLTLYGTLAFPMTFTKDVRGQRKTFGQIAMPMTFVKDLRGQRKTFGQITFPIIFTKEAVGRKNLFGQLSMQTLFGKETAGLRKTFSQFVMPMIFSKEVVGRKQTFGRVELPISVPIFVAGYGWIGAKTYYGQLAMPINFDKQIIAQRKTFGQITSPLIFGSVAQGSRHTFSELEFDLIWTIDTNGQIKVFNILNDAFDLYLGDQDILAAYVGSEQVWP